MTTPTPQPSSKPNVPDFSAGAASVKKADVAPDVEVIEKPKTEKRKPLKPREKKFLEVKTTNPELPDYKAAMIATGTTDKNVASTQAARMLQNVTLKEALIDALDAQGFTIEDGAKALIDGLQAHKSTQGVVYEKDEEGNSTSTPTLVETDVPDHGIRISAAKAIFSFLQDKNEPAGGGGSVVNFNIGNVFVKKGAE